MRLILAALLAAVSIFLWEFVAHSFTPLGEAGIGYLPNSDAVSSSLQSIGGQAGIYVFPTAGVTAESSRAEKQKAMERMNEEMKTKPSGLLVYKPAGTEFTFGKNLAVQFALDLAKAVLLLALLAHTRLTSFGRRVGLCRAGGRSGRDGDEHSDLELVRLQWDLRNVADRDGDHRILLRRACDRVVLQANVRGAIAARLARYRLLWRERGDPPSPRLRRD